MQVTSAQGKNLATHLLPISSGLGYLGLALHCSPGHTKGTDGVEHMTQGAVAFWNLPGTADP